MTSNVGSKYIYAQTSFGFVSGTKEGAKDDVIKQKLEEELKREFKPEFLNRIDDTIIFRALNKDHIHEIVEIMLGDVKKRLEEKMIFISYDKKVCNYLVENGFDEKNGARPLRRSIQQHFEDKLADTILNKQIKGAIEVKATCKKNNKTKKTNKQSQRNS